MSCCRTVLVLRVHCVWGQGGQSLMCTFSILASFLLSSASGCFCSFLLLFKHSWSPSEPTMVCLVSRAAILPCTGEVLGQVSAQRSGWSGSEYLWPSSSPPCCRTAHQPPPPAESSRHTSSGASENGATSNGVDQLYYQICAQQVTSFWNRNCRTSMTLTSISMISFVMVFLFLYSEASFALNFCVNSFGV